MAADPRPSSPALCRLEAKGYLLPDFYSGATGMPGRFSEGLLLWRLHLQKISKDNVDVAVKGFGAVSKGVQAIAVEVADYSKKSFEEGTAALEKLFGAKSLDKAIEVQTDYFKTAYEGFVAKASRTGELYADLARETYKPIETAIAKVK
jgi:Phasin protein